MRLERTAIREYKEAAATIRLKAEAEGDMVRVTGPTYDVRAELKQMGGKWDPTTKAWIVPKDGWGQAFRRADELKIKERVERIFHPRTESAGLMG